MNSYSSVLNTLLIAVVVVACLFFAREVLIPVTLAGILSFMLAPVVRMLQNFRLPRALAVIVVVLSAFAAIFALGTLITREVTQLASDLPRYQFQVLSYGAYSPEYFDLFHTSVQSLALSSPWSLLCLLIPAGLWCFGPWPCFSFSRP
jgi:predicted PurR-regulated permease PerM